MYILFELFIFNGVFVRISVFMNVFFNTVMIKVDDPRVFHRH